MGPASPPPLLPDGASRPAARTHAVRRRARATLWRLRFVVAAVCCGLVASMTVTALRPPPPPTLPVVVAARDLSPGSVLTERDVEVVRLPVEHVPDGALGATGDVVGRSASVELTRGLPLAPGLVAAGDLAANAPPGTVVAPVRLADPAVAALLSPGDTIDLLLGTEAGYALPGGATDLLLGTSDAAAGDAPDPYLARGAIVLPSVDVPAGGGGLLDLGGSADAGVTLVAVAPAEAVELARVATWGTLTAVLVP